MRPRPRPLTLACLGLLPACQLPQSNTSSFTTNVMLTSATTGDEPSSSSSTTAPAPDTSTTGEDPSTQESTGDSAPVLDVGTHPDAGTGAPAGCNGKIDFLFVISRYGNMKFNQDKLVAAFPAFIKTIETQFADFDYHIMVVDGDPEWGLNTCDDLCPAPCGVPDYPCGYTPSTCDQLIGAGTVFPAGGEASNRLCDIADQRRYMTKGQPDLEDTFACVAQIGMSGGDWLGEAITAAVSHGLNGPGGCNGGFLREDALLMVTFISNTYDTAQKPWGSTGTPDTWRAAVLKEKREDPGSIVMLGILDTTYAPTCHADDRICQLVRSFPYSLVTDVQSDSYVQSFKAATSLVDEACAKFIPPG